MPVFPSKEWCECAVNLVNSDPESTLAGKGWRGDFGAIIEAEEGRLTETFVIHVVPNDSGIERFEVLRDADDLEDIEPAYLARAPYSIWKGLLTGALDPVETVLKGRIQMKGNLQPLIERMRYRGIADRVFATVQTQFIDEQ